MGSFLYIWLLFTQCSLLVTSLLFNYYAANFKMERTKWDLTAADGPTVHGIYTVQTMYIWAAKRPKSEFSKAFFLTWRGYALLFGLAL